MDKLALARQTIERLARIDRASCSPGERKAAEWIAAALREHGAQVELESHRIHGTYWWPLGLTSALGIAAAIAASRGRRMLGMVGAAVASAAVVDDLGAGSRWLRRLLPKRATTNVVARTGDVDASRTLLVVAHHDAAHSGFFFNPAITSFLGRHLQRDPDRPSRAPAVMAPLAGGPALAGVAALTGWRRLAGVASVICAGIIASMIDIALRPVVPGANDNLSGVGTLLAIARCIDERPVRGLSVWLVSTGAEESLMEGMRAFAAAHFRTLSAGQTHVLCVDSVGGPHLVLVEAEGMLRVRAYDLAFKDLVASCAAAAGLELRRGTTMRLGTDGYLALRHGFPAAMLMSLDDHGNSANYHWPTDTPDRVDYGTLADAITLCERVVRRLALKPAAPAARQARPQSAAGL